MDLSALPDRGERLAEVRFTSRFFRESLRAGDPCQLGVAILARNSRGILRVQQPMNVPERAGRPIPGLRDKRQITELGHTFRRASMASDREHFMEREQQ